MPSRLPLGWKRFAKALLACGLLFSAAAWACSPRTAEVQVADGTIHYQEIGEGPAVVLLHGLFAQKEQWTEVMCRLSAAGYRAVAPDLPGYGKSRPFALDDYGLERQVELLDLFLHRTIPEGRVHLAGNSMGGSIAALYARRHPDRLISLALVGAPLGVTPWGKAVTGALRRGVNPFIPARAEDLRREMRLLFTSPPVLSPEAEKALLQTYTSGMPHYQAVWQRIDRYQRILLKSRAAPVPTLFLWGDSDRVFEWPGRRSLRRHWRHADIRLWRGMGHLPHLENAQETARHLQGFFAANQSAGNKN